MKTKYTPAPWTVYERGEFFGIEAESDNKTIIAFGDDDEWCGVRGDSKEEMLANSNLIAAAPELLEVLEYGVNELDFEGKANTALSHAIKDFVIKAKSVIFKAKTL